MERLIRRAQDGDKAALETLVRLYYDRIFTYCHRHTGSRQAAEDLCQDTFVSVLEHIDGYRHTRKFLNWLYVVAGNKCRNYHKMHREIPVETVPEMPRLADDAPKEPAAEEKAVLQSLVHTLPDEFREAIILRYYEDLNFFDMAKILGCSVSTAKYRVKKALALLQDEFVERSVN